MRVRKRKGLRQNFIYRAEHKPCQHFFPVRVLTKSLSAGLFSAMLPLFISWAADEKRIKPRITCPYETFAPRRCDLVQFRWRNTEQGTRNTECSIPHPPSTIPVTPRFHPDRIVGRNRHYFHSRGHASARAGHGQGKGAQHFLH